MNLLCGMAAVAWLVGCGQSAATGPAPTIAATSSYLQCAVQDLLGAQTPVLLLAEPGMCPGHFDIRPSQVQQLRACRVLLRFDFQGSLDRQLGGIGTLSIAPVAFAGGMCEPDSYVEACRQAAAALTRVGLLAPEQVGVRVEAIRQRIDARGRAVRQRLADAGIQERPVVASIRQAAFCRWLGLRVVAVLRGADSASVRQVDQALALGRQAGCGLVIANRPEGTQLAEAVASRLGAKMVVFDNFPDLSQRQRDFDGLLHGNVDRLIAASQP